jgi:hypothetical protein
VSGRTTVPRGIPASLQGGLFEPRVHVTRPAQRHRRAAQLRERVQRALRHFPELHGHQITVGVTRSADGIAVFDDMTVRFNLRRDGPTYYCIGHELTHLLQALKAVPMGEVQCDIWTLARGPLFLDEPPCYLPLPPALRRAWKRHRSRVSYLCARAINERATRRQYIRWLKQQLAACGDGPGRRTGSAPQPASLELVEDVFE